MSKSSNIANTCKKYNCNICNVESKQKSHHDKHIQSEKHKDKRALQRIKIEKLSKKSRQKSFNTIKIEEILDILEGSEIIQYNETNRESLKEKIHEIHNFLRNNGVGYGMNALKVFNIIYGLKKIEESGLIDEVNLKKPECEFKYLLKLANEGEDEKLVKIINKVVLDSIWDSDLSKFLYYDIPKTIQGSVFIYLIKQINKITKLEQSCNVLLSGKIYEYFIGRDESAISELGAYFTNRHITNFIFNKLKPSVNADGTISSIIDPFGGSGGFTVGYIQYLKEHHQNIDWNAEINNIYHYDMNSDVIKSAGLEIFCLTGVIPNMNNLKSSNSFKNEFGGKKYKYVITNPPYGGDKHKKTAAQKKREKISKYIKQELSNITDESVKARREKQLNLYKEIDKQEKKEKKKISISVSTCSQRIQNLAKKYSLTGKDKESCSLMLFMDMVEIGGTVIAVLKEGVFFNKNYKNLRKCLIEHFNIREIISIPQNQFENTATKTCIIIFENVEVKTKKIIFSELLVEKYEEDKFMEINENMVLLENKGDVKNVCEKVVSSASKDEILKNDIYSFNGKDYKKNEIVVGDGYELVKLGDICEIKYGTRITKENNTIGDVPVYGGGDITFYTNKTNRDPNTLIISRYAMSKHCVRLIHSNFYLNDSGLSIHNNDNQLQLYINYLLLSNHNQAHIYKFCTSGSIQRNVNMNLFKKLQLPIPKSPEKTSYWVDRISTPYNEKIQKQNRIKELESFVQNRIREIGEHEECDEKMFEDILIFCKKKNKYKASDGHISGLYKFYTSSQDKILYRDDYEFENSHILIGRGGNPSLHLVSKFSVSHDDVYVIKTKSNETSLEYIYNYLRHNINLISSGFQGSTIKHSSKTRLNKIKLKIPQNKQLIKDLEPHFEEIERLHVEVKNADKLYKQYIQELSQEAIVK